MKRNAKRIGYLGLGVLPMLLLAITACQAAIFNPPRLATATAQAEQAEAAEASPLILEAPTATPGGAPMVAEEDVTSGPNPVLSVWVNETSEAHEAALEEMAGQFTAEYNIDVEMVLVSPMLLPDLVTTAVLSDTLPDIIIHPLEYSVGWAEDGVFDLAAHEEVVEQLGAETFNPQGLRLLTIPEGLAAIPSDAYPQIVLYRQDWVEERDLPIPNTFDDMFAYAEATFDAETLLTAGFVVPTESNLIETAQVFEQMALANGCELITIEGEVSIISDACLETLNFYYGIINRFSPPGIQTVPSTQNAYLGGRTGMVIGTPSLLPLIAGLDRNQLPVCPECGENERFLAENSALLTAVSANETVAPITFGSITSLGITTVAQPDTAVQFATYWFNEGYPQWLAVSSERKVPLRWGTPDAPTQFIDPWGTEPLVDGGPSLTELFGETAVASLKESVNQIERWGFDKGQGALVGKLYEELTISIVLQELLSGYFDTSQTSFEAYNRIVELIPAYSFPIVEPTEEPEG